jgi:hypothetical protein
MPQDTIETTVRPSYLPVGWMHLPKASWHLFPRPGKTVELEYNGDTVEATVELFPREKVRGLRVPVEWLAGNFPENTNLVITIVEPMKKYHIKVVK